MVNRKTLWKPLHLRNVIAKYYALCEKNLKITSFYVLEGIFNENSQYCLLFMQTCSYRTLEFMEIFILKLHFNPLVMEFVSKHKLGKLRLSTLLRASYLWFIFLAILYFWILFNEIVFQKDYFNTLIDNRKTPKILGSFGNI